EERLPRRGLPDLGGRRIIKKKTHDPGVALPGPLCHFGDYAMAQPGEHDRSLHPLLAQRTSRRRAPLARRGLSRRHSALPLHPLALDADGPMERRYRLARHALSFGGLEGQQGLKKGARGWRAHQRCTTIGEGAWPMSISGHPAPTTTSFL